MVVVDIKHCHSCARRGCHVVCCDCCVVEEAITAIQVGRRVMARWSAQTICKLFATENYLRCRERCVHRATRCNIRTLSDWGGRFETPPTKPSVGCSWFGQLRHLVAKGRAIEKVGNHLAAWAHFTLVVVPCSGKKVVQPRIVHCIYRIDAPLRRWQ